MKQPLFSIITDLHLDDHNHEQVSKVIIQSIDKSIELQLGGMFVGGDIFNSRKSQTLAVLNSWSKILDYCHSKKFYLIAIPGNHDKLDYTSEQSYLDIYSHHPAFTIFNDYEDYDLINGVRIHLIPFFDEKSTYNNYLSQVNLLKQGTNYLLTHIAVNGVRNNDGSKVDQGISENSFDQFDKVFVGHYHDKQQIGDNIFYIGAIMQKNYGEDDQKGMTVVYDDGSHELHLLQFTKYETVHIDMDVVQDEQLNKLCQVYSYSDDNIRFKFTGTKQKLDALDKHKFDQLDIDVKCEYKDPTIDVSYNQAVNFSGFDNDKINEEWLDFSGLNEDIDEKTGTNYLKEVL